MTRRKRLGAAEYEIGPCETGVVYTTPQQLPLNVRFGPKATEMLHRPDMTQERTD